MAMGDGENENVRRKDGVDNNEGKLMESVSSAASEVDWPAMGSFADGSYRSIKCAVKVDCRRWASFPIPLQS
jgi:hypothetical protein